MIKETKIDVKTKPENGLRGFSGHDKKMMEFALEIAHKGYGNYEVPVACVIVHKDAESSKVIAYSHNLTNTTKNNFLTPAFKASNHCEINCLRILEKEHPDEMKRKQIFENCTAYVTLEPCIMCGYALNIAGIRNVIYGAGNTKFGGNNSNFDTSKMTPNPYTSRGGLFAEEAVALLAKFYERGNVNLPEEKRHRYKKLKV